VNESSAREAVVRAGRRLGERGLVAATEGNLSVRLEDGRLLVTPSGRRKDALRTEDLLVVPVVTDDAAGEAAGAVPTSDIAIHRAIHLARPDIGAVVHAHLPASMALTLAGEVPDPTALPETALLLSRLPFIPYAAMGSADLARTVADALVAPPQPFPAAVLLERHGAVAVGDSVDDAVDRLELIEVLCRAWCDALLVRSARRTLGEGAPGT
jgi:L-fuculose-phosphate aldolase